MTEGAAVEFELEVADTFTVTGRWTFATDPWSGQLPNPGDALVLRRGHHPVRHSLHERRGE